jgi:Flp pilus assembly protein TadG
MPYRRSKEKIVRNRKRRGGAMMEFTILVPVWLSLLLGTLWIGSAMIGGQQTMQMARDLASLYSRGVNFSSAGGASASSTLTNITQQLGTMTSTGTAVAIFSTLTYVGNSVCASAGSTYGSSSPPSHTASCSNYGKYVFTQQYKQGNTSLLTSKFGTPPSADMDANYNVTLTNQVTDSGDRSTFSLLPAPAEAGQDGYQSGQPIYLVEIFFTGSGQMGYTQGSNYAYAVF